MLTEYGGKVPPVDQVSLDDMKEVVAAYNRSMAEATIFVDERKPGSVAMLEKVVRETLEKTQMISKDLRSGKFDNPNSSTTDVLALIEATSAQYEVVGERATRYKGYEELFGQVVSNYGEVEQVFKELTVHTSKWQYLAELESCSKDWLSSSVAELSPEAIQQKIDHITGLNYKMLKSRKDDEVVVRLKRQLDEFKAFMPLLQEVSNPALESRHWAAIYSQVLKQPYEEGQTFCIEELVKFNILNSLEQVQTIGSVATKEFSMLKTMEKMEGEWQGLDFRVLPYKDTGTFILGGTDEVQTILDDQIVKIQAMNASPFVKPFAERAQGWEAMLQTLQDMLDNWLTCQATWLYLEPIFSSDDIVKQMPTEGEMFKQVDAMWRGMMKATANAPSVVPIAREKERVDKLVECNGLLEAIQKGLAAYLEKKR